MNEEDVKKILDTYYCIGMDSDKVAQEISQLKDAEIEGIFREGVKQTLDWCKERHYLIDYDLDKFIGTLKDKYKKDSKSVD